MPQFTCYNCKKLYDIDDFLCPHCGAEFWDTEDGYINKMLSRHPDMTHEKVLKKIKQARDSRKKNLKKLPEISETDSPEIIEMKKRRREKREAELKKYPQTPKGNACAGFIIRMISGILDAIFLTLLMGILFSVFNQPFSFFMFRINPFFYFGSLLLMIILYMTFCHALWGQTVGKKIVGIKVVNMKDEKKPNFFHALWREVIKFPLKLLLIIDPLWIFIDKRNRTLHDVFGRTYVIIVD